MDTEKIQKLAMQTFLKFEQHKFTEEEIRAFLLCVEHFLYEDDKKHDA